MSMMGQVAKTVGVNAAEAVAGAAAGKMVEVVQQNFKDKVISFLQAGGLKKLVAETNPRVDEFVQGVKNVEDEIFGRYQNSSLLHLHGESAQMVVSALLHHLRLALVRESLITTVVRKLIRATDLHASELGTYYISLLFRFEEILNKYPRLEQLQNLIEELTVFIGEIKTVKEAVSESRAISVDDKAPIVQALQDVVKELSNHIQKIIVMQELSSISDELKALDLNMRQVHIHLIKVLQYAAIPDADFKAVSSLSAARKYPCSLTRSTIESLGSLMDTNIGALMLDISSPEVYPVYMQNRAVSAHTLNLPSGFQGLDPKLLVLYKNRDAIFEIIKKLYLLQNSVGIFIQSNQTIIQGIFSFGEIIISNNPMLREMVLDHLRLGEALFENALNLCKTVGRLLKEGTKKEESKILILTKEKISQNQDSIEKLRANFATLFKRVEGKLERSQHPGYVRNVLLHFMEIGLQEAKILKEVLPEYDDRKIARLTQCKETILKSDLGSLVSLNDEGMVSVRQPQITPISRDAFLTGQAMPMDRFVAVVEVETAAPISTKAEGSSVRNETIVELKKSRLFHLLLGNLSENALIEMINAVLVSNKGQEKNRAAKEALRNFICALQIDGNPLLTEGAVFERKHLDAMNFEQLWGVQIRLLNICFISSDKSKREYYKEVHTKLKSDFRILKAGEIEPYIIPDIPKKKNPDSVLPFNPPEAFTVEVVNVVMEHQQAGESADKPIPMIREVPGTQVDGAPAVPDVQVDARVFSTTTSHAAAREASDVSESASHVVGEGPIDAKSDVFPQTMTFAGVFQETMTLEQLEQARVEARKALLSLNLK